MDVKIEQYPETIVKRDGRVVPFDHTRIARAIYLCFQDIGATPETSIETLVNQALNIITAKYAPRPTVEQVQDAVEHVLLASGEIEAARHYIHYRAERARQREERPIPAEVRDAFDASKKYFPTPLQEFQFFDKYSRFDERLGRRETWEETVRRAVDFLRELADGELPEPVFDEIYESILAAPTERGGAIPSMRLLAMAGPAARRNNISIYNCSYLPVDSLEAFPEALLISMAGCGVGYSVEQQYVEKLQRIKRQRGGRPKRFVIPDTTEGWAEALLLGLRTWFDGGDVAFDFSLIRPAGAILRTKGGRASGPEPLRRMLDFVRSRVLARQGSFLTSLDAHDIMCAVGGGAVSGGHRRTAMIALFDYDDQEMRNCKTGDFWRENPQRWNANNSAVWPDRPLTQAEIMQFMLDMDRSRAGEPGIFSRRAANLTKPERRQPAEFGCNPCVTGDTWVMTASGPAQVKDLVGKPHTALVDGQAHAATGFWQTGVKPVLRLRTKEGYSLRLTANHKVLSLSQDTGDTAWAEAGELKPGDRIVLNRHESASWEGPGSFQDGWLLGSLVSGGDVVQDCASLTFSGKSSRRMMRRALEYLHASVKGCYGGPIDCETMLRKYNRLSSVDLHRLAAAYGIGQGNNTVMPEIERASSEFYRGFLRGLFDAEGTVADDLRISQDALQMLEAVQRMLLRLGIASRIDTQVYPELVISDGNIAAFADRIGFSEPEKQRLLSNCIANQRQMNQERWFATVESIDADGEEMVYDCSVDDVHAFDANGIMAHNCGEINLRPYQFCNLSAVICRREDTEETLRQKVRVAAIIGTIQSLATNFPGLRPIWKENCEDERLIGVDLNGQLDCPVVQDAGVQRRLRQLVVETNAEIAGMLGINRAAASTSIKPSGNSSQLFNTSSGLHPRWSKNYIRNVRIAATSPLFPVLKSAGVPMSPENGQTPENATTWVIHFPVKSPDGAITRHDRSATQQCSYWLQLKENYTEHNPSVTITYKPDELLDVAKWVWKNQDRIGGMTFLPSVDAHYEQMPYVEISRDEYERLAAQFPEIDFAKVYRYEAEDMTTAAQEVACASGGCDLQL